MELSIVIAVLVVAFYLIVCLSCDDDKVNGEFFWMKDHRNDF